MTEFWRGYLLAMCITCSIQDWYGLDAYIQQLKANWWNVPWWLWIIPATIICVLPKKKA